MTLATLTIDDNRIISHGFFKVKLQLRRADAVSRPFLRGQKHDSLKSLRRRMVFRQGHIFLRHLHETVAKHMLTVIRNVLSPL